MPDPNPSTSAGDTSAARFPPDASRPDASRPVVPTRQMQAVLDHWKQLGGRPMEACTPQEARRQPTLADAVADLVRSRGGRPTPQAVAKVENRTFRGPGGDLPIRIHTPDGQGPFPLLLYLHGGGWTGAGIDACDASARALANAVGAVVASPCYRQGPAHRFPAAHEDAVAAYRWLLENAGDVAGDPARVAVVGEGMGANLAANVAIAARDQGFRPPLHQLLIQPLADDSLDSASYRDLADAQPLGRATVEWMLEQYLDSTGDRADPRIALVRQSLESLPSVTIITAELDPLRCDGEKLAAAYQRHGTPVELRNYEGVTHGFFGMSAVLDEARAAQDFGCERLRRALGCERPMTMPR